MKKSTIIISLLLILIIFLICMGKTLETQRYAFVPINHFAGVLIDQKTGKAFVVTTKSDSYSPSKIETKEIKINWDGHKKNQ